MNNLQNFADFLKIQQNEIFFYLVKMILKENSFHELNKIFTLIMIIIIFGCL